MAEPVDQLELEHLPRPKMLRRTKKIVRHDFEQVLTACARLSAFSSGTPTKTEGPIDGRQMELAIDDLVLFAIHARRLIENTTGKRRFTQVTVPFYKSRLLGGDVSIWKIINTIVHYDFVEIIRSKGHLEVFLNPTVNFDSLLNSLFKEYLPPVKIIGSSKNKSIAIEISNMIKIFQKYVLIPIIYYCDEKLFFLTEDDLI